MKKLVYIAGPLTKGDVAINIRNATSVWKRLRLSGLITPICPHWSFLADIVGCVNYESWMDYDFDLIQRCDAILRIPGESSGADREVAFAKRHRIPVFTSETELLAWSQP